MNCTTLTRLASVGVLQCSFQDENGSKWEIVHVNQPLELLDAVSSSTSDIMSTSKSLWSSAPSVWGANFRFAPSHPSLVDASLSGCKDTSWKKFIKKRKKMWLCSLYLFFNQPSPFLDIDLTKGMRAGILHGSLCFSDFLTRGVCLLYWDLSLYECTAWLKINFFEPQMNILQLYLLRWFWPSFSAVKKTKTNSNWWTFLTFYLEMLRSYLQKLFIPLLASRGSAAADFHLSDLPLQFGSSPLTVSEPALGIPQPQQLLLQETVLSLQQGQLSDGWPCVHLCILSVSPRQPSHTSRRDCHGIVRLQQELQDGVLLNNCSLRKQKNVDSSVANFHSEK